ncbi:MAG TPA: prepilin-type N-terminal cleavage/methylation domain-containing protein [Candidatus Binatia bacterium]|nr:prepilin-type N-terminal cleavage/methylation domain-containing protein [Candidatus Binatia bacterium]
MKVAATPTRRSGGSGFTLIELLLTVVVVLLLLGAMVINFGGLQQGVQLDEGGEQFESLIRFARAHAANTGCRVQLTFEELVGDDEFEAPLGNVFVSWEPEPLDRPGEFKPLAEVSPLLESLLQLVEIDDVRPLGTAPQPGLKPVGGIDAAPEEAAMSFAPIMFYPDGSSDSAEVILRARSSDDNRKLAVRLVGLTGNIKRVALPEGDLPGTSKEKTVDAN